MRFHAFFDEAGLEFHKFDSILALAFRLLQAYNIKARNAQSSMTIFAMADRYTDFHRKLSFFELDMQRVRLISAFRTTQWIIKHQKRSI
jgi:hypothetical protein